MKENERAKTYGKIKAQAHSGSNSFEHLANFLEDVEESPLTNAFNKPAPPSGTAQSKDEELLPAEIWNFTVEMDLKAPADRTRRADDEQPEDNAAGESR